MTSCACGGLATKNVNSGEVRNMMLLVTSVEGKEFTIQNASYRLWEQGNPSQIIDSGTCSIDENTISAIISFETPGRFVLEFTYHIGPETYIQRPIINVN